VFLQIPDKADNDIYPGAARIVVFSVALGAPTIDHFLRKLHNVWKICFAMLIEQAQINSI
jgi:hypothetical protein